MSKSKGIGFNRNIKFEWLEAVASFSLDTKDTVLIRKQLQPILAEDRSGSDAIRKSIDILINIWIKSEEISPALHQEAVRLYEQSTTIEDRLWLHYGLTMIYYPFFYQCISAIGQLSRYDDPVKNRIIINKMAGEMGNLGSLERSVQRVVASLRDWEILVPSDKRFSYKARKRAFSTSQSGLEVWLLACSLKSHVAEEIPITDLQRLPALFPFCFLLSVDEIRKSSWFEMQRQGSGNYMVRLHEAIN